MSSWLRETGRADGTSRATRRVRERRRGGVRVVPAFVTRLRVCRFPRRVRGASMNDASTSNEHALVLRSLRAPRRGGVPVGCRVPVILSGPSRCRAVPVPPPSTRSLIRPASNDDLSLILPVDPGPGRAYRRGPGSRLSRLSRLSRPHHPPRRPRRPRGPSRSRRCPRRLDQTLPRSRAAWRQIPSPAGSLLRTSRCIWKVSAARRRRFRTRRAWRVRAPAARRCRRRRRRGNVRSR